MPLVQFNMTALQLLYALRQYLVQIAQKKLTVMVSLQYDIFSNLI